MIARVAYFLFILTPLLAITHWSGAPVAWDVVLLPWMVLVAFLLLALVVLIVRKIDPFYPKDPS